MATATKARAGGATAVKARSQPVAAPVPDEGFLRCRVELLTAELVSVNAKVKELTETLARERAERQEAPIWAGPPVAADAWDEVWAEAEAEANASPEAVQAGEEEAMVEIIAQAARTIMHEALAHTRYSAQGDLRRNWIKRWPWLASS